ncbi:MAG: SGNH/GDSL hydrolase family protein [Ignavibacteriales bacterium]|nr:SGNH/GDSL hydrolase family protein [Ignavibacteriales bacterium]
MNVKLISFIFFTFLLLFNSCNFYESKEELAATSELIKYTGRVDFIDSANVKFSWSGVSIETMFEGTSIAIKLIDGNNDYNVFIDGNLDTILVTNQDSIYIIANNLQDTIHHIQINKRTEASLGEAIFGGFIIDPGKSFLPQNVINKRKIEFIGDSFVAGFGIEGLSPDCSFDRSTENNYLAYGPVLARRFNADYFVEAISGIGVVRNFGDTTTAIHAFPYYYEKTNIYDSVKWDFKNWIPDAVVIRLGRNDFWRKPFPTKSQFKKVYQKFILKIRKEYPNTRIFCLGGPANNSPQSEYISQVVKHIEILDGDKKLHFINLNMELKLPEDFGCQKHPNIQGQKKIADFLEPIIRKKMMWN